MLAFEKIHRFCYVTCILVLFHVVNSTENPYPVFIPYVDKHDTVANQTENLDIRTLGLDQPTRWLTPDPLADQYPGWSPYTYVLGNPLRFIDPDGREVWAFDEDWIKRIASELNERIPGIGVSYEQRTREVEDGDGNVIVEEYYALTILEDSGFDWGEDIYTMALYDVISSTDIDFKVIVSEKYYGKDASYGTNLKSWGGGKIDPRPTGGDVWLHPDPVTRGNPFIGIFLHEAVGHGHPNMKNATEIEYRFGLANRVRHHGFVGGIRWKEIDLYKKRR